MDFVKKSGNNTILGKLLLARQGNTRLYSAWIALFMGMVLLLSAILLWSVFQEILHGNNKRDSLGSTYITISKKIDTEIMSGRSGEYIGEEDLRILKSNPQVEDVGLLKPAAFKVSASLGSGPLSFYTLLFLESAPDRFMDELPQVWRWQEEDRSVPIILSRDFLNMYNYIFAPSQGLPLLSEETVQALGFSIVVGEGSESREYRAQVEGFSDRISSVLVPENFIEYGNKVLAGNTEIKPSRAILKVKDPSDHTFSALLKQNNYTTNNEQLRFNKMRSVVDIVSSGVGIIAGMLLLLGMIIFILFIELTLSKSRPAISLLLQIGYKPGEVGNYILRRYLPVILSAPMCALFVVVVSYYYLGQVLHRYRLPGTDTIPASIFAISLGAMVLLVWQSAWHIRRSLRNS